MPTTDNQWAYAQSWIGQVATQAAFDDVYDRLRPQASTDDAGVDLAIEETMRAQLAALVNDQPSSITVPGGLSVNFVTNITTLREMLQKFSVQKGQNKAGGVTKLTRDRGR
jgi:hypothetical protein